MLMIRRLLFVLAAAALIQGAWKTRVNALDMKVDSFGFHSTMMFCIPCSMFAAGMIALAAATYGSPKPTLPTSSPKETH
jgi:hypothetical protein